MIVYISIISLDWAILHLLSDHFGVLDCQQLAEGCLLVDRVGFVLG